MKSVTPERAPGESRALLLIAFVISGKRKLTTFQKTNRIPSAADFPGFQPRRQDIWQQETPQSKESSPEPRGLRPGCFSCCQSCSHSLRGHQHFPPEPEDGLLRNLQAVRYIIISHGFPCGPQIPLIRDIRLINAVREGRRDPVCSESYHHLLLFLPLTACPDRLYSAARASAALP